MDSKIEKTTKSQKKKITIWLYNHIYEIIAIWILLVGVVFFCLHRDYDYSKPIDGGLWAQYGDYVGGLVGTLLAYISIKLLNRNLQEQIIANKELRKSNEDSRKVAAMQQFDSSFSTLIEMYRDCQNDVKHLNMQWAKDFTSSKKEYNLRVKEAVDTYLKFYEEKRSLLSSYYRLLYRIMQTIDDANVDDDTKRRYAKIFRCQISEEELILLRYNASTHYGKKMQVYINRYNLLKHLPKMHLLEFKEPSILALVNGQEELFDRILNEIQKKIVDGISMNASCGVEKAKTRSNKIELENFDIVFDLSKSNVKIDLVYVNPKGVRNRISDNSLQLLLNFYILDTFVYASFECYQPLSSVEISSDIKTERNSKKHTVWVQLKSKDNYALVLSSGQLDKPQK